MASMASMAQLKEKIVSRFSVSSDEAERIIREHAARSKRKASIIAATHRVHAEDDADYKANPAAWREEVQKRMQAIEIMEEGTENLKKLQKLIKRVMDAEQKLIGNKTAKVNNKDDDWWDLQHSGWAMGGREMFAQLLCDLLRGLDEPKLAKNVMDKIGFKRSIPIPEDDIAPLLPQNIQPGDVVPAYEEDPEPIPPDEEPVPEDAEGVAAMLVRGARRQRRKVQAARKWFVFVWGTLGGGGGSVAGTSLKDVLQEAQNAGVEDYHEGHVVTVEAKNEKEAIEIIESDLYNGDFVDESKVKRVRKSLGI